MRRKLTLEQAKLKLKGKHPFVELLSYAGADNPCQIRCPIHGVVNISTFTNLYYSKTGCPECGKADNIERLKTSIVRKPRRPTYTDEEWIARFREAHGDKYEYPLPLVRVGNKIRAICPKHGEFLTETTAHARGTECPQCHRENCSERNREAVNKRWAKYREEQAIKERLP